MKEASGSSETPVLTREHGVTTQKTPFFKVVVCNKMEKAYVILANFLYFAKVKVGS
jgi:hypothetical protein